MMPQELVKTSFPQLRNEVAAVLGLVEQYGVPWRSTRFGRYLASIDEAAQQSYPRSVSWQRDHETQRLFWEAVSQTQQLINASGLWPSQDAGVIRGKLKAIVDGPDLPPVGSENDHPRNTLLELTTSALLHRSNFDVSLPANAEDTLAIMDGQVPFAVECKRPTNEKTLEKNIKDLRRQLRTRIKKDNNRQGIAVIAADRLLGLNASMPFVHTMEDLVSVLDRKAERLCNQIRSIMQREGRRLFPKTKLGAIVLVGTVFVGSHGMPITIGRLAFFLTSAVDSQARDLLDALDRHLQRRPRQLGLNAAT